MCCAKIAIVGRANVGKSTLFNRLVGRRIALVDDRAGVTRDRREAEAELFGLALRLVDTAGFEDDGLAELSGRMRSQSEQAARDADIVLFVIDARMGVTPMDEDIARWLHQANVPTILVANKCEGSAGTAGLLEAYRLGWGEALAVSAEHGEGIDDIYTALTERLAKDSDLQNDSQSESIDGEDSTTHEDIEDSNDSDDSSDLDDSDSTVPTDSPLKLAVVGRPNAGKSTLINQIIGSERLIVGPEAGITRDSIRIDHRWQVGADTHSIQLIDTAGIRKRARVTDQLEKLSVADSLAAMVAAEVAVLLIDASEGLGVQDLRIANRALESGCALIVALNKWDCVAREKRTQLYDDIRADLDAGLAQGSGVPCLTLSAARGKGIEPLLRTAFEQRTIWSKQIATARLNRWFAETIAAHPPPMPKGQPIKLRYITQSGIQPPQFLIFGSRTDLLPQSYIRYLSNALRQHFDLAGVPIRISFRKSHNPYAPSKR